MVQYSGKENQLCGYNLSCRRWKQEAENIGCSQDQSQEGAHAGEAHNPVTLVGGPCPGKRAGTAWGRLARGGLFAESRLRGQTVQCVWQVGSSDRACIVQPIFFFFFLFLGCLPASLPCPLCLKCFVAFRFWHTC